MHGGDLPSRIFRNLVARLKNNFVRTDCSRLVCEHNLLFYFSVHLASIRVCRPRHVHVREDAHCGNNAQTCNTGQCVSQVAHTAVVLVHNQSSLIHSPGCLTKYCKPKLARPPSTYLATGRNHITHVPSVKTSSGGESARLEFLMPSPSSGYTIWITGRASHASHTTEVSNFHLQKQAPAA